jgi:hypothetical protein
VQDDIHCGVRQHLKAAHAVSVDRLNANSHHHHHLEGRLLTARAVNDVGESYLPYPWVTPPGRVHYPINCNKNRKH